MLRKIYGTIKNTVQFLCFRVNFSTIPVFNLLVSIYLLRRHDCIYFFPYLLTATPIDSGPGLSLANYARSLY